MFRITYTYVKHNIIYCMLENFIHTHNIYMHIYIFFEILTILSSDRLLLLLVILGARLSSMSPSTLSTLP